MKKSNKKGFTLVELIVVSTMMIIVMGAILNLIEPINNFYKNVQSTANSNDIGNLTMKYLESELRYTTEVLILEDFSGVPEVKNGFVQKIDDTNLYNQYTDCLIVENNPTVVRGAVNGAIAGNTADPIVARRKSAFGQIYKVSLDATGTLNTSDIEIALGEEVYDDYSYQYTIRGPQTSNTSNKIIDVDMRVYRPEYDANNTDPNTGSHYIYDLDKPAFTQRRTLELLNINQIGRGFVMHYFSDSPDVDGVQPIPTEIKKQTGGFGDLWEESLYDGSTPHTFIFYRKDPDPAGLTSTNVTVRLLDVGWSLSLTKGQSIPDEYGKDPTKMDPTLSWYLAPYGTRTGPDAMGNYYDTTIGEIKDEATGRTLQQMIEDKIPIDYDTNFRIEPSAILIASPIGSVNFYNSKDEYDNGADPTFVKYIYASPNAAGEATSVSSSEFPADVPLGAPRGKKFDGWIDTSGAGISSSYTSGHHYFYPKLVDLPRVYYTFYNEDGAEVANFKDDYYLLDYNTNASEIDTNIIPPDAYPDLPGGPKDSDKIFVGWRNKSDHDQKFPKPGSVLSPSYYTGFSSDKKIEFEPELVDKGRAFNNVALQGAGSTEGFTKATRTIAIANTGDIASEGEITITIESPVDISSVELSGSYVSMSHGFKATGGGIDRRVYIIKYANTIPANDQRTLKIIFNMDEATVFEDMKISVTTPDPPEPEEEPDDSSEEEDD